MATVISKVRQWSGSLIAADVLDDELVGIYLDALRRLGPAPSAGGWGEGEGS